nr:TOBE domain-containing protein [Methylocaldum sp. RMAD-M]
MPGIILAVASEGDISLVDVAVEENTLTAMLVETAETAPYLRAGNAVSVLFKETEVSLGKALSGRLSLRNRLQAEVVEMLKGELLAEVKLDCGGHRLVSIVTRRAAERLELAVGDRVEALIKANEVMLGESANDV